MEITKLNILLVEDDAFTAQTNKRLLSSHGNVSVARNVEDAHELIKTGKYELAFFDLNLHGELDGLKLLKLAKIFNVYSVVLSGEIKREIFVDFQITDTSFSIKKPLNNTTWNC